MLVIKRALAGILYVFLALQSRGQKLLVDSNAYDTWPRLGGYNLSNNGKFSYWRLHDPVLHGETLVLQSVDGKWKAEYPDVQDAGFTQNSQFLFLLRHDSLLRVELDARVVEFQAEIVGGFNLAGYGRNDNFLIYKLKKDPNRLQIVAVNGGEARSIPIPENYWYDPAMGAIAFLAKEADSGSGQFRLKYFELKNGGMVDVFHGDNVENLIFNSSGTFAVFISLDSSVRKTIWTYNLKTRELARLTDDHSISRDSSVKISGIERVNADITYLFITLKGRQEKFPGPGIDVWNYKDAKLQSEQLNELKAGHLPLYSAALNISSGRVQLIEDRYNTIIGSYQANNYVLLFEEGPGDHTEEWNWNKLAGASVSLLSLRDGSKRHIPFVPGWSSHFVTLSPDEKYVLFYDPLKADYCSYEIASGIVRNLTDKIHTKWTVISTEDWPDAKYNPIGIAGFTDDNRFALIYDQYDIYKVDLAGQVVPAELTHGYGRSHHIVLRVALGVKNFSSKQPVILEAFNRTNKDAGFYRLSLGQHPILDSLNMGPVTQFLLIKARDVEAYGVLRGDAATSPDFFYTKDLQYFTQLTNFHPEAKYNWMTSELVTWRLPDGRTSQGILYKPENFDPRKKYPLILHYYEQLSDLLHKFWVPQTSQCDIEIPLYVSNGYLVFIPDIHFKIGHPGQSAFEHIVSAVKYLCQRDYVDKRRLGLQGTSFGGFETDYLVTHTNMFAAAMSSSGFTDEISYYGGLRVSGASRQSGPEVYRGRIGAPLSLAPDLYAENSPVLRANRVTTPLLMMTNTLDDDIPCEQGIELFTALRRLGKKVWMLQYDGEGHYLGGAANKRDLTIRVFQFFNCYLKGATPPKWMTVGIPAERKGIESGLELDTSGRTP